MSAQATNPRVTIHVQPPSRVPRNAAITPAVVVRAEFNQNSPLLQRSGEIFATAVVCYHQSRTDVPGCLQSMQIQYDVKQVGTSVYWDYAFESIRISQTGTFTLHVSISVLGSEGSLAVGDVFTHDFVVE